jgi:hypothetical protein
VSKAIKIILLVVIVCGVVYGGLTVYANFAGGDGKVKTPDIKEAQYTVVIENTGSLYYVSKFEQFGSKVGARTFVLHSFWELSGRDFRYRQRDLILDEKIYGTITIRPRPLSK